MELCPRLFAEVTVEEALEGAAMASLVLSHLVNRIMDSIETELLCERCELFLASASAVLCIDTHREVLLRAVRQDLAEELSEFGSVLSLLKSVALVSLCDFRITFTVSLAAHSEVHADFRALAREVLAETLDDARINVLGNADMMLIGKRQILALLDELGCRSMADRALSRSCFAFVNITSNRANKLFHNVSLLIYLDIHTHRRWGPAAHCSSLFAHQRCSLAML